MKRVLANVSLPEHQEARDFAARAAGAERAVIVVGEWRLCWRPR